MWWIAVAAAAPITPFGSATTNEEAIVLPLLFGYADHLDGSLLLSEGYGNFDLYLGATGTWIYPKQFAPGPLEVFPRFFVADWMAIVPHLLWTPGTKSVTTGLEFHWNATKGRFAFVADAGWRPTVDPDGFHVGTALALIGPEVYLVEGRFSVFVELDPVVDLTTGGWTANVLPGVSVVPSKKHPDNVAIGVQVPVRGGPVAIAATATWFP
jgi:hypothetical protein